MKINVKLWLWAKIRLYGEIVIIMLMFLCQSFLLDLIRTNHAIDYKFHSRTLNLWKYPPIFASSRILSERDQYSAWPKEKVATSLFDRNQSKIRLLFRFHLCDGKSWHASGASVRCPVSPDRRYKDNPHSVSNERWCNFGLGPLNKQPAHLSLAELQHLGQPFPLRRWEVFLRLKFLLQLDRLVVGEPDLTALSFM